MHIVLAHISHDLYPTPPVKPEEDEVGGRYRRINDVVCPYCYAVNRIVEETTYRMWFRCWNCSGTFQY